MSRLSSLPPDELGMVLMMIKGLDIVRLWLCGDLRLNYLLENRNTVPKLEFRMNVRLSDFSPRFMSSFRDLQDLSIAYKRPVVNDAYPALWLDEIGPKLTSLAISGFLCSPGLISALCTPSSHLSVLQSLNLAGCCGEWPADMLGRLQLPNLTFLNLGGLLSQEKVWLSSIPPTLTSFEGYFLEALIPTQPWRFSGSLRDLRLKMDECISLPHLLPSLPDDLNTLLVFTFGFDGSTALDWAQLPRNLRNLTLPRVDFTSEDAKLLPENLELLSLPENLLSGDLSELFSNLPKKLKSLIFAAWPELTPQLARLLPSSITYLDDCGIQAAAVDYMPSGMQKMVIFEDLDISCSFERFPHLSELILPYIYEKMILTFPPGLKTLTIENGNVPAEVLKKLPSQLVSLFYDQTYSSFSWEYLPRHLTSLTTLPSIRTYSPIQVDEGGPEQALDLPRTLTALELGSIEVENAKWFGYLPSGLKRVDFGLRRLPPNAVATLAQTCPNLSDITLLVEWSSESQVTSEHLNSFGRPYLFEPDQLSSFPPKLKRFRWAFKYQSIAQITFDQGNAEKLPKTLQELSLPQAPLLPVIDLSIFPRALHTLHFANATPTWFRDTPGGCE